MNASEIIRAIAAQRRTLLLGGAAVILHGQSRNTDDFDVWVDPLPGPEAWAEGVLAALRPYHGLEFLRLGGGSPGWKTFPADSLAEIGREDRIIRVRGAAQPIDIFYQPNEIEIASFDEIWGRSKRLEDGTHLMEEIDLLLTKQATGRDKDRGDIGFLEWKVNEKYLRQLTPAGLAEAKTLLDRYATIPLLQDLIRDARDPAVRELARQIIIDLSEEGDPFAAEYLREHPVEYQVRGVVEPAGR